ncbi:MAG: glycosyltransferase [Pirellulaceae bacterium]
MTLSQIALVTRSFWPNAGNSELGAINLLTQLRGIGAQTTVFTSQWDNSWSRKLDFAENEVLRIPRTSGGAWASSRYVKALSAALGNLQQRFDSILVFGWLEEVDAALKARKAGIAEQVVLRVDSTTLRRYQMQSGHRRKFANLANQVDVIAYANHEISNCFRGKLVNGSQLQVIPDCLMPLPFEHELGPHSKTQMREAVSDIHPLMMVNRNDIVGVHYTSFENDSSLSCLIDAWSHVAHRFPMAKLWIVGDGPQARASWEQINSLGLVDQVVMVGNFDTPIDPLLIADFYVHPESDLSFDFALRQSAMLELPLVIRNAESTPKWFRRSTWYRGRRFVVAFTCVRHHGFDRK